LIWLIVKGYQKLQPSDVMVVLFTIVGTILLLTNGSFKGLSVSSTSLIWGIISGISLAFYTLYARKLLDHYSSIIFVGCAMLISGLCMNFVHPVCNVDVFCFSVNIIIVLVFIIIFGTTLAS